MRIIMVESPNKMKKVITLIESKTEIKIKQTGRKIVVEGNELNEYICEQMIKAIDMGFDAEDALLLLNPDFVFHSLNIKTYTKKENLKSVRARVIGRDGRAKGTIEELSGAIIVVKVNNVGIIVRSDHLDSVVQAISSLIRGSKHANVFAYLEKQNALRKKIDDEDLGLKISDKDSDRDKENEE